MADLQRINAEFFKPYLTILKYFRCTGIDIFGERNVLLYKIKHAPYMIFFCTMIVTYNHWRYVIEKFYSGADLLELAVDLSFSYNSIECSLTYLHILFIKDKIKNFVMKLENIWSNDFASDDKLETKLLKRDQVKLVDLYNYSHCKMLELFIHFYLGLPLVIMIIKKFILKRDVSYVTPLKFTLPFDYQSNFVIFVTAYLLDYWMVYKMAYVINGSVFFLSVTMSQLRTLFMLLQQDFKYIIKGKDADTDVKLKKTIHKHKLLSEMLVQLGDSYGAIFFIHGFFVTITICFYGIAARINCRLEDMKNFMISVITVINVFYCCREGQLVTDSASDVATAIYDSPWEDLPCKHRKMMLLSILRSQRATYISSTSFTKISLTTFKTIMNMAWTIISLMTQIYTKNK